MFTRHPPCLAAIIINIIWKQFNFKMTPSKLIFWKGNFCWFYLFLKMSLKVFIGFPQQTIRMQSLKCRSESISIPTSLKPEAAIIPEYRE